MVRVGVGRPETPQSVLPIHLEPCTSDLPINDSFHALPPPRGVGVSPPPTPRPPRGGASLRKPVPAIASTHLVSGEAPHVVGGDLVPRGRDRAAPTTPSGLLCTEGRDGGGRGTVTVQRLGGDGRPRRGTVGDPPLGFFSSPRGGGGVGPTRRLLPLPNPPPTNSQANQGLESSEQNHPEDQTKVMRTDQGFKLKPEEQKYFISPLNLNCSQRCVATSVRHRNTL